MLHSPFCLTKYVAISGVVKGKVKRMKEYMTDKTEDVSKIKDDTERKERSAEVFQNTLKEGTERSFQNLMDETEIVDIYK